MTEEAYLTALATSLGTTYEPLDRFTRADCPLDDKQLIQAAAAGLLPLNVNGRTVWIVAPRCQTARRLANPRSSASGLLESFRLTSSDRLWRFIARYTQGTLGGQAANGLRRAHPLLSNRSRAAVTGAGAAVLAVLAVTALALVPAATIGAFAAVLSAIFLAAAALRLSSALYPHRAPTRPLRIDDRELPIYTIVCALYREERVVGNLVAAIRALDYPDRKA
jgi:glycosyltransferase XagB